MRFLDSNIFIYAFYKPKRLLSESEKSVKASAKKIVTDVSEGNESAITTVVHLSEVVNILKQGLKPGRLAEMVASLIMLDSIDILAVGKNDYLAATELGRDLEMDSNDALAVKVMQARKVKEIYSFDKVFERIEGISRLPVVN